MRKEDEMDFPDEVEYQTNEDLYLKYKEYKALKSFRESEWNPYSSLPKEFDNIYVFKNYVRSMKVAKNYYRKNGLISQGMYIKIFLKDFPFSNLQKSKPIIISSLLSNERKMTIIHMRIQRHTTQGEAEISLKSNQIHEI